MSFICYLKKFYERSGYFTVALLVFVASFLILPTSKMVNNVYYVLLATPALGFLIFSRGRGVELSLGLCLWGGVFFCLTVAGMLSADVRWLKYVLYAAVFMTLVSQFVDPRPFRAPQFARGLFWVLCGYILGSAIFYWVVGRYVPGERVLWLPARMTGPIYTSMWLACCFTLALPVWVEQRRWFELFAALLLAVFCMAYVLQSRSGLLGMVALGGLVAVGLVLRRVRHVLWLGLAASLGALLVYWATLEIPEVARLFARADSGRFELWGVFFSEWVKCGVWLGCGVNPNIDVVLSSGLSIQHPHNIFLALGLYSGLFSLLVFLLTMVVILRQALKGRDPWGGYLLLALIMLNFDGDRFIDNPNELWLLVLLPAALIINKRDVSLPNDR
ncbi:O-antigen ligase family protein [Pseudomonas stutzeri]|uniref:O-antigen ligase family protein n=1 Tax=Stutzerimonas stutzeri TaxID=316 RepID=UPI000E915A2F|nr:O-antigen ligase family protein [Stutzerimonas stutzeri]HAW39314.1 hypothetical protein [Pseudomonas sp.]MCF0014572.1 O-antigen ligase family protein [Stutzerimonas stutzeri]MCF0018394.1 O-antigen ligase family protein [Stutzerimonas stutzeri]MDH1586414.1 O-antigen ligase family protein [Stutzerimonas stutzeri]RRV51832.1 O-antigen ligase domain-containing protein [Stutzerimonas stutzeri]